MKQLCLDLLRERGVELDELVQLVWDLQYKYIPDLTQEEIKESLDSVMEKREVQNALLTGINLDILCEQGKFVTPELETIVKNDYGLYGVDEVLAYGICNIYGSIALTNFGYIDKSKPGIIGKLNEKGQAQCNTFLDDIVGAIVASAASRLAHKE